MKSWDDYLRTKVEYEQNQMYENRHSYRQSGSKIRALKMVWLILIQKKKKLEEETSSQNFISWSKIIKNGNCDMR